MQIAAIRMTLYVPESHSLKDKRQIVRSVLDQTKRRFNVSIAEIDALDRQQSIVLGLAVVSNSSPHAQASIDEIVRFIEDIAEAAGAECVDIEHIL